MARTPTARLITQAVLITIAIVLALYLLYLLRRPIAWLIVALFLAVAMAGPVNFFSRRMKRGWAITLAYVLLLLAPVGLAALVVPPIVTEASELVDEVPAYASDVREFVNENERLRE